MFSFGGQPKISLHNRKGSLLNSVGSVGSDDQLSAALSLASADLTSSGLDGTDKVKSSKNGRTTNEVNEEDPKDHRTMLGKHCMSSTRLLVLLTLCLQNSFFTVLRRYSQGVRKEKYSSYECLLVGEIIKMLVSAYMIRGEMDVINSTTLTTSSAKQQSLQSRLLYLTWSARKMVVLALIYGAMNILSFLSLRNIGAGMFTIFAQCKIFTTALCSTIILQRSYSWTQWRALATLMLGVLLFSEPIWNKSDNLFHNDPDAKPLVGVLAVLIEVSLSGFASIYFEKVIKMDPQKLSIWERNFQLALGSFPVYLGFMMVHPASGGMGSGWSGLAFLVASLGAAGGLLVALSIKYGDSILKTLATTGAICLSSVLDAVALGGPLTPIMMIAGAQVVLSICNYTFDPTPAKEAPIPTTVTSPSKPDPQARLDDETLDDEEIALVNTRRD